MKKNILIILVLLNIFCGNFINAGPGSSSQASGISDKISNLVNDLSGGFPKNPSKLKDFTIIDLENKNHQLFDFNGKVILLNFWATWCPPCRAEMPSLQKLYNEYKNKNFKVLAVTIEDLNTVKNFLSVNKYNFPIFLDDNKKLNYAYGTGSIPTTYIIDKNGNIIAQFIGARDWDSPTAKELINILLK